MFLNSTELEPAEHMSNMVTDPVCLFKHR